MRAHNIDSPALVMGFDNRNDFEIPTFCKSISIKDEKKARFLLPLDYNRHWKEVRLIEAADIPFQSKRNNIVWRGATTGSFRKSDLRSSPHRMALARCFDELDQHDVGFSAIVDVNVRVSDIPMSELGRMVKDKLNLAQQLQYKYLLSLEGNDVASGLKWMLNSNSVVLMPDPTCQTWACEALLVPFVHYVPVAQDLSDLIEKFEWCETNQVDCVEIAQNGKAFIAGFLDVDREKRLEEIVFKEYFAHTQLVLDTEFAAKVRRWLK